MFVFNKAAAAAETTAGTAEASQWDAPAISSINDTATDIRVRSHLWKEKTDSWKIWLEVA